MSGMLQWMAISISEGEGKEEEVVGWGLCTRVCFDGVELSAGNYEVESLWVRIKGKTNKADILLGVLDGPAGMKWQMKHSVSSW